jgi:serine/threonine protein kinase
MTDYIAENGITIGAITKLCEDMCSALTVLEQKHIIHRDIKPANIFVNAAGDFKLGDFGVARHMEGLGSMSVKGTYNYMAPEILKGGAVGANSDLYSLGLVLYRLLNYNRAPFLPPPPAQIGYEDDQAALDRRLSGEPLITPARAELSLPLTNVIMRACEYEPSRRFQTAGDMRRALQDFRETQLRPDLDATVAVERNATRTGQYGTGSYIPPWNQQGSGGSFGTGMGYSPYGGGSVLGGSAQPKPKSSSKTMFTILFSVIGVVVVMLGVILAIVLSNKQDTPSVASPPATVDVTPTPTPPAASQTDLPAPSPSPVPPSPPVEHTYRVFVEDVTWQEAYQLCEDRGGHLAVVTSQKEEDEIVAMVERTNAIFIWLGGYTEYDKYGDLTGVWITGEPFDYSIWCENEPSGRDLDGTAESYIMLWYIQRFGGWTWNDQRNDPLAIRPDFKGKLAYVCEFE